MEIPINFPTGAQVFFGIFLAVQQLACKSPTLPNHFRLTENGAEVSVTGSHVSHSGM
jgi:hypothetical protein